MFVKLNGEISDFYAIVNMMDDDIREYLYNQLAPCSEQEFVDAYIKAHEAKYGEQFDI